MSEKSEKAKPAKKWSTTLKSALFSYLAISKAFYWIENFGYMQEFDGGRIGTLILERFIQRDFMIISSILVYFWIDRLKINQFLKYGILYLVGVFLFHLLLFTLHGVLFFIGWSNLLAFTISFISILLFLNIKEFLKNREKKS